MPPKFTPITAEHVSEGVLVWPPGLKTTSGYTKGYLKYAGRVHTVIIRDGKPLFAAEADTIKQIGRYASIPQIMAEKGFIGMRFEIGRLQKQRAYASFEGRTRDRVGYLYSKNGDSWWSFPGHARGEDTDDDDTCGFTPEQIASMLARISTGAAEICTSASSE